MKRVWGCVCEWVSEWERENERVREWVCVLVSVSEKERECVLLVSVRDRERKWERGKTKIGRKFSENKEIRRVQCGNESELLPKKSFFFHPNRKSSVSVTFRQLSVSNMATVLSSSQKIGGVVVASVVLFLGVLFLVGGVVGWFRPEGELLSEKQVRSRIRNDAFPVWKHKSHEWDQTQDDWTTRNFCQFFSPI